jgi:internalin A
LKGLTRLRILELVGTKVTDGGLAHLKGLTSLQDVYLGDTKITDAGVRQLQEALPSLRISR